MSQMQALKWIAVGASIPILAMACALAGVVYAQGSLDPPAAPAPTMKTLDEIYSRANDAVLAAEGMSPVNGIGWSRARTGGGELGTVPAGYELVILMFTSNGGFSLEAGGTTIFSGEFTGSGEFCTPYSIPNGCMVVGPGLNLTVDVYETHFVSVIGYLRSISK